MWQNEGGQLPSDQGFGQNWPVGGAASGGSQQGAQPGQLNRGEVLELYKLNVEAVQETLRRHDRANGMFLALSFAILTTLLVLLKIFEGEFVSTMLAVAAVAVGGPVCFAWTKMLKITRETFEKNLLIVREIERTYGFPFSPFGGEDSPNSDNEVMPSPFSSWDDLVPRMVLYLFLAITGYVFWDPVTSWFFYFLSWFGF